MTALLESLALTALLEYIDLLNRYSRGPSWGLLGPLSGWGPGQNAPVAPPPCGRPSNHIIDHKYFLTPAAKSRSQYLHTFRSFKFKRLLPVCDLSLLKATYNMVRPDMYCVRSNPYGAVLFFVFAACRSLLRKEKSSTPLYRTHT